MRGGGHDDDRAFLEGQDADAVKKHDAPGRWPPPAGFGGNSAQSGLDLLDIGLVLELSDAGAAFGMISDGAAEEYLGPAIRTHRPK